MLAGSANVLIAMKKFVLRWRVCSDVWLYKRHELSLMPDWIEDLSWQRLLEYQFHHHCIWLFCWWSWYLYLFPVPWPIIEIILMPLSLHPLAPDCTHSHHWYTVCSCGACIEFVKMSNIIVWIGFTYMFSFDTSLLFLKNNL